MGFRLLPKLVTVNDLEQRNAWPLFFLILQNLVISDAFLRKSG